MCRYHWCRGPGRKCEGQAIARSLCLLLGPPWGRLRGEAGSASPWAALWRLFWAWWFYCASCSGSLTSSTTTFQGVSRPRVIAQGVTASLIGIELWGEAEGGRIKISLPKWSFVEGVQVLGLFAAFSISCWSRGPQIGTLKIPLDGNALHDSATITHGGLACCGPSHANPFVFPSSSQTLTQTAICR